MLKSFGVALFVGFLSATTFAETLADAAAREKRRRAEFAAAAHERAVVTEQDLEKYSGLGPLNSGTARGPEAAAMRLPADAGESSPSREAGAASKDAAQVRAARAQELKEQLGACQAQVAELQEKLRTADATELRGSERIGPGDSDFRSSGVIPSERSRVQAELTAKLGYCSSIEDAARRERIPPGLLR